MMAMIREDLDLLGVHHDVFFSERTLHEKRNGRSQHRPDAGGNARQGLRL